MTTPAKPFTDFAANRYIGYPHANAFAEGGASLVFGQIEETTVSLWKRHRTSGEEIRLGVWPIDKKPPSKLIWYDVALDANTLIASINQSVWLFDLSKAGPPREIYRAASPWVLDQLLSITADGRRMVISLKHSETLHCKALLIDLASQAERVIVEKAWFANHFHFCQADPSWIGFAHEGATETIPDRTWVWHAEHAPQGKCVCDQASDDPELKLCFGHERWAYHDRSAVTIAYGVSPAGPRGLWEVFTDGRPARLVSGGERDFHCDITRDGRFAIVDTTGPFDAPGKGWDNSNGVSDILVVDMKTGRREFGAVAPGASSTTRASGVQPGRRYIYYNQAEVGGERNRIMEVSNPWK